MKQIIPGVYTLTGLMAGRVYLIEDHDGLTLIDTSIAPSANRIAAQIKQLGRELADLKRILITHVHPDHVGALPRLKQLTGARVIVPAGERDVAEGRAPIARPARDTLRGLARMMTIPPSTTTGTPVDQTVSDEDTLREVLDGLIAIGTPGHSPDHMAYWHPGKRILFCGDVMMNLWGLTLPFAAFTVDMDQDRRSIGKVALLEPEIVCFGHGEPLVKDVPARINAFAQKVGGL
jgi:glyoxylase-like metal-dependent hydrolase (beta-lactamase superfamily II)